MGWFKKDKIKHTIIGVLVAASITMGINLKSNENKIQKLEAQIRIEVSDHKTDITNRGKLYNNQKFELENLKLKLEEENKSIKESKEVTEILSKVKKNLALKMKSIGFYLLGDITYYNRELTIEEKREILRKISIKDDGNKKIKINDLILKMSKPNFNPDDFSFKTYHRIIVEEIGSNKYLSKETPFEIDSIIKELNEVELKIFSDLDILTNFNVKNLDERNALLTASVALTRLEKNLVKYLSLI